MEASQPVPDHEHRTALLSPPSQAGRLSLNDNISWRWKLPSQCLTMSIVLPCFLLQARLVGSHLDGLIDEASSLCVIITSDSRRGNLFKVYGPCGQVPDILQQ